jgi:hypothetical protein
MAGSVATDLRKPGLAVLLVLAAAPVSAQITRDPPSLTGRWILTLWPDSSATPAEAHGLTGSLALSPARGTPRAYGGRYQIGLTSAGLGPPEARVVAGAGPGDSVRIILNPSGQPRPLLHGIWRLGAIHGRYQSTDPGRAGRFVLRRAPR